MIPNQWYPILDASRLQKKPLGVRRLGRDLVLWRKPDGRVIVQEDRCPHKGARLSGGQVVNGEIECPYHGFRFNAEGSCTHAPCLGTGARLPEGLDVQPFRVREQHDWIWLWHGEGEPRADLPIIPEMINLPRGAARISYDRPIHYTRYIESIIEFYHVPWVHRGRWYNNLDHHAIGGIPGNPFVNAKKRYYNMTKVANSRCEVNGERIDGWMEMVMENDPHDARFPWHIVYVAPCLIYVENNMFRAGQYMTPIDDNNTHIMGQWLEYYPMKWLPTVVQKAFARLTLVMQQHGQDAQDYRIMLTQTPRVSDVGVNRFTSADEMNSRFLALRRQLKRAAGVPHRLEVIDGEKPTQVGGVA